MMRVPERMVRFLSAGIRTKASTASRTSLYSPRNMGQHPAKTL